MPNRNIFIREDLNRVSFKDLRFYDCLDRPGVFVPGLTTALSAWPKDEMYLSWLKDNGRNADALGQFAMDQGSAVHDATERYDKGEALCFEDRDRYTYNEWNMFLKYVEFCDRFEPQMIAIEWRFGDRELGYGGTLDRVMRFGKGPYAGKTALVDIKTGNLYDYYAMQLVGYKRGWEKYNPDYPIDCMGILHLNATTRTNGKEDKVMQGKGWAFREITQIEEDQEGEIDWGHTLDALLQVWYTKYRKANPKNQDLPYRVQKGKKDQDFLGQLDNTL